jgi:hypothetical protein
LDESYFFSAIRTRNFKKGAYTAAVVEVDNFDEVVELLKVVEVEVVVVVGRDKVLGEEETEAVLVDEGVYGPSVVRGV